VSTDLTTAPRSQRDRLADRTDVLDKVGVLRMLPDDMHVTTDMVAEFYGVDISTVRQTVNRNREELDSDGYDVLTRAEVSDKLSLTPDELGMPRTAGSLAMFPRRAVLRVGMLLRDSPIARQVRDYLLAVEDASRTAIPDISTPSGVLAMADMFASTARQLVLATEQLEEQRPMVERAKTHAAATGSVNRQTFAREVIEWAEPQNIRVLHAHVFDFLGRKLHLFITGERTDQGQATTDAIRRGLADNRRDTTKAGRNTITGVLTPTGQEYAWDRIIRYIDANGTLALPREIGGVA
jgi:hypothetical protein